MNDLININIFTLRRGAACANRRLMQLRFEGEEEGEEEEKRGRAGTGRGGITGVKEEKKSTALMRFVGVRRVLKCMF